MIDFNAVGLIRKALEISDIWTYAIPFAAAFWLAKLLARILRSILWPWLMSDVAVTGLDDTSKPEVDYPIYENDGNPMPDFEFISADLGVRSGMDKINSLRENSSPPPPPAWEN